MVISALLTTHSRTRDGPVLSLKRSRASVSSDVLFTAPAWILHTATWSTLRSHRTRSAKGATLCACPSGLLRSTQRPSRRAPVFLTGVSGGAHLQRGCKSSPRIWRAVCRDLRPRLTFPVNCQRLYSASLFGQKWAEYSAASGPMRIVTKYCSRLLCTPSLSTLTYCRPLFLLFLEKFLLCELHFPKSTVGGRFLY